MQINIDRGLGTIGIWLPLVFIGQHNAAVILSLAFICLLATLCIWGNYSTNRRG